MGVGTRSTSHLYFARAHDSTLQRLQSCAPRLNHHYMFPGTVNTHTHSIRRCNCQSFSKRPPPSRMAACCPPGSLPALSTEYTPAGTTLTAGGVELYEAPVTGMPTSAVVVFPDIFGWNGGRVRAIAGACLRIICCVGAAGPRPTRHGAHSALHACRQTPLQRPATTSSSRSCSRLSLRAVPMVTASRRSRNLLSIGSRRSRGVYRSQRSGQTYRVRVRR
jgi:hypothetical protein